MARFSLLLLLLGALTKDSLTEECPYNWKYFQGHCYLGVSGYPESALSWYDAEDNCRRKNATLVSILSSEENDFVSNLVKPIMFTDDIWIGLHALTYPGKFNWSDGSKLSYQIWDSTRTSANKCVALRKDNGEWKDKNCGYLQGFVCKRISGDKFVPPPVSIYVPSGNCPATWYKYGSKCYKFFGVSNDEKVTWKEAKEKCQSLGENHFLVSIHSESEQMFLTSLQAYHNYDAWIGLERSYTSKLEMWSDNSIFNYTNWVPGAGGYYWVTQCSKLTSTKKSAGKWVPTMCNTKSGYICQREPDPAYKPHVIETNKDCQKGYSNYRNACYRLVKQRNSWSEAEKQCRQENGHLVSINDNFEFAFLYNFVKDVKEDLWIGLRDEDGDGIYSWTDDWPNLFLAWEKRPGQSKTPKCTYMNNSTRLWNVDNCKLYLPYVCKVTPETPPAIPIIKHKGKCPSYWNDAMDFGGKYCYQIINQQTLSWGKALQLCLTHGSTLASFHSIYETELLWPLIGDDSEKLWLGLFKRFDGEFVWQDGSKVNFTNWNPSARKEGDCVYMTSIDMKWIQQPCDDGFSHPKPLCMKEKDRS